MDWDIAVKAVTAILPVTILLLVLDRLDIFNLIKFRTIAVLVAVGGIIAALSYFANLSVLDGFPIGRSEYTRYVAPGIEETLKAIPIVYLFATNRVGFKLDAALAGFAVGAGFSMVENAWYLDTIYSHSNYTAWLVRGFGTAVMHAFSTAFFAAAAHEMTERQAEGDATQYNFNGFLFLPGLLGAYALHSAFNHFPDHAELAMALTLLLAPLALFFILSRSEHATQHWIKADRDAHRVALEAIRSGHFAESEQGRRLKAIAMRFQGAVKAADIFAYLELKMELVLHNEEMMLGVQEGETMPLAASDREKVDRLEQMEHRLGPGVLGAIAPALGFSRNDVWELEHFKKRVKAAFPAH
jgi:RsiW-degrading membrane proteinase PrsW (M82 family)